MGAIKELPDLNINTGAQSINTERASLKVVLQNQITEKGLEPSGQFWGGLGLGLAFTLKLTLITNPNTNPNPKANLALQLTTRFQYFLGNLILVTTFFRRRTVG